MGKKSSTASMYHKGDMEASLKTLDVSEIENLQKKLEEVQNEIKNKDKLIGDKG